MATKLIKPITREMMGADGHSRRPLLVTLAPGDVLTFRAKGTRTAYSVYLGHCYRLAQILQAEQEYRVKKEAYAEARKQGRRARRPARPVLPFSKVYFDAINS